MKSPESKTLPCRVLGIISLIVVSLMLAGQAKADEHSGQWSGNWVSCRSGHHGPLEATICQISPNVYRADFRGRFAKILPFRYSVNLRVVERTHDSVRLAGAINIGRLMGDFCYEAVIENGCLRASYRAKKDWGTWTLRQVAR